MRQIDCIASSQKIAHCRAVRRSANAIVVFPKGVDNHIPNVIIIIDDENVFRCGHHSSSHLKPVSRSCFPGSLHCDLAEAMCR
jgi:hypothetical protein